MYKLEAIVEVKGKDGSEAVITPTPMAFDTLGSALDAFDEWASGGFQPAVPASITKLTVTITDDNGRRIRWTLRR